MSRGAGLDARGTRPRPRAAYTSTSMRRVVILGSTGSIGVQALDVVARSDDLQVVGLAAAGRWERLLAQAEEFGVRAGQPLRRGRRRRRPPRRWGRERCWPGAEGLVRLVAESGADLVLNGLVGLGRARAHGRRARRGHRRRARQQGEPRGRRRARDAARRGDRRARDPGRLRAFGAVPAAAQGAARNGRATRRDGLRRPVPRARPRSELARRRARARRSPIPPGTWAARSRSTRRR